MERGYVLGEVPADVDRVVVEKGDYGGWVGVVGYYEVERCLVGGGAESGEIYGGEERENVRYLGGGGGEEGFVEGFDELWGDGGGHGVWC